MSVTATLWTSVSGLLAHGEKMNVVGNNLANVNTVGFKSQRMDFADFVYQDAHSLAGQTQIGRGVKIGTIIGNFSQGPFETTTNATDLAIEGKGFFQVQAVGSDETYYTRAGNFTFDKEGYLNQGNFCAFLFLLLGFECANRLHALLYGFYCQSSWRIRILGSAYPSCTTCSLREVAY